MGIEWKYKNAFRKAVGLIERFYPDYALIGGFARNFYAPPETTLDTDFLVDLDDYERLAELIESSPFHGGKKVRLCRLTV